MKHQNPPDIPIKNLKNHDKRPMVCLQPNLQIPLIKEVIHRQATKYRDRNTKYKNELITALTDAPPAARRLKRLWPEDLIK
jgi:hypothetical protein